jgi:hypothetical protein
MSSIINSLKKWEEVCNTIAGGSATNEYTRSVSTYVDSLSNKTADHSGDDKFVGFVDAMTQWAAWLSKLERSSKDDRASITYAVEQNQRMMDSYRKSTDPGSKTKLAIAAKVGEKLNTIYGRYAL